MNKLKIIPGWNRRVKKLYKKSRNCHKVWINEGKNRFGFNYEEMKESKNFFKKELKSCKKNKDLEAAISLLDDILQDINKMNEGCLFGIT